MDQTFLFHLTPPDPDQLSSQLSSALEKRTELISRRRCPTLWKVTDKLNGTTQITPVQRERRKKFLCFLGAFVWLASSFLLIPGLVAPEELSVALTVASCCFGVGTYYLWRYGRTLLASFSLLLGLFLLFGALGNRQELGELLWLGIADLVIGTSALLTRRHAKLSPFDRAARKLLNEQQGNQSVQKQVKVTFSTFGMAICWENPDGTQHEDSPLPYSALQFVLETEDLLLPISPNTIIVLQKKDLRTGSLSELRHLLCTKTQYTAVYPFQADLT